MRQLDRFFQWQGGSLAEFTAKARRIFLIALPFAVLFWAFGWGITGAKAEGGAWFNIPMVIGGVSFVAWICGSGLMLLKGGDRA